MFAEQGYERTSLREIAERLGVTKAALYYHFARKEDILLALHLRLHALGHDAFDRLSHLDESQRTVEVWTELIEDFIDQVLANRKLFLFHVRNQNALEQLLQHNEHNEAEHQDMQEQLQRVLGSPAVPLELRVRMACSMGAVMGAVMESGEAFADVGTDELAVLVRGAVRDLMGTSPTPARPMAARPTARRRPPPR
jgi:AcrR family transcriptional regulator